MCAVWQTLDSLAGNNLNRINDSFQVNWFRSFSKKDLLDSIVKSQWIKSETNQSADSARKSSTVKDGNAVTNSKKDSGRRRKKSTTRKKRKKCPPEKLSTEYDGIVECSYNIPRITARLEGLMGTNVVRLTDRAYMHQLRKSHEADCQAKLQERIDKREKQEKERQYFLIFRGNYSSENCPHSFKLAHSVALAQEMERERKLVMQGKETRIPEDMRNHPVFKINQKTNEIIAKRRSKLKTNREKNAERLIRQGMKWERNRLVFEDLEKKKELELQARKIQQTGLEEQYRSEDALRGLDLLRIHDKKWKPCELDLKKFLETEEALMKQRFIRKPVQYNSDPKDVRNVAKARKKFRETEERIRKRLEEQLAANTINGSITKPHLVQPVSSLSRKALETATKQSAMTLSVAAYEKERDAFLPSDVGLQSNENLSAKELDSQHETDVNYKAIFQKKMENDVKNDLIMTKEAFDALHYEDPLIALLKATDNVHDLYRIAKDIILQDSNQVVETVIDGGSVTPLTVASQ
ncbi:uncharacterized protein LOC119661290 isoform X1 [Hermetia illucens]|uniref:uncharacterized protein LOC119661290 isoform X1 n=1 Tax=Hermetia illucens TaxID=343691 RepID=UPI0018CC3CFD|nr:uncharacterized protein LOC119661290 isoform X1 [Hermetia illucens]